ncbi:MAG: hypothetical protein JO219_08920 [Candidatus Eremiobacteraeota bacterium]|nr:hypothetical protein [Candidatus Eremiobacteraeota bacterium]MBV8365591.1 hypothetical protein [Candidatus Eremiobacteraeota bacterium]
MSLALGHAILIGIVAGLRTMVAPLALTIARHSLLWILFAALAAAEIIADKFPRAPSRLRPAPLIARSISGGACAYFLAAGTLPPWIAIACGVAGALAGSYAGYEVRKAITRSLRIPDFAVAVAEDVIAILLAVAAVKL